MITEILAVDRSLLGDLAARVPDHLVFSLHEALRQVLGYRLTALAYGVQACTIKPMASSDMEPAFNSDPLKMDQCPRCGYSLQGLHEEGLCPECGIPYRRYEIVLYSRPARQAGHAWESVVPIALSSIVAFVLLGLGQPCLAVPVGVGFWLLMDRLTRVRLAEGPPVRLLLGPQGYAECLAGGQARLRPWSSGLAVRLATIDRTHCRLSIVTATRFAAVEMPYPVPPSEISDDIDLIVECDPDRAEQVYRRILTWCPAAGTAADTALVDHVPAHSWLAEHGRSSPGVLLSLSSEQVEELKAIDDEDDRIDFLQSRIDEGLFDDPSYLKAETDTAWNAIQRCLTDGRLGFENDKFPLSHAILGGEQLYSSDHCILSLKTRQQVADIARALCEVTKESFFSAYDSIVEADYAMRLSASDRQDAWEWLEEVIAFYQTAAAEGRAVVFTFHR